MSATRHSDLRIASFVTRLTTLDRAELAQLRAVAANPYQRISTVAPYVAPYVLVEPDGETLLSGEEWAETVLYHVAPLYALHPVLTERGSFGEAMGQLLAATGSVADGDRCLGFLTLPAGRSLLVALRHIVRRLAAEAIPVPWADLIAGLLAWAADDEPGIQRRWLDDYYAVLSHAA